MFHSAIAKLYDVTLTLVPNDSLLSTPGSNRLSKNGMNHVTATLASILVSHVV
jgi:hypothetical protein